MTRLFVVFRTYDRIWTCNTFTRELAPFELDTSSGPVKLMFLVDQIVEDHERLVVLSSQFSRQQNKADSRMISFYCHPHTNFTPQVVQLCPKHPPVLPPPSNGSQVGLMRRFSLPVESDLLENRPRMPREPNNVFYFVLPMRRCTVLSDAHMTSALSREYSHSRVFRKRFLSYIKRNGGFRDCLPDYEEWTEEEKNAWENYLPVPYMIDFVAIWPKQKIDQAWQTRLLRMLGQQVTLEEGFAWLSTLGGAHSSLGEKFIEHAEQAGKISSHQLQVALQLGNEHLIARCYIFYSWSLMQRGKLAACKRCILNTWKFCHTLKVRDEILENMCKAAWNRRRYRKSLLRAKKCDKKTRQQKHSHDPDNDSDKGKGEPSGINSSSKTVSVLTNNDKNEQGVTSFVQSNSKLGSATLCNRSPSAGMVNVVKVC